jgi:hypothetical protein
MYTGRRLQLGRPLQLQPEDVHVRLGLAGKNENEELIVATMYGLCSEKLQCRVF